MFDGALADHQVNCAQQFGAIRETLLRRLGETAFNDRAPSALCLTQWRYRRVDVRIGDRKRITAGKRRLPGQDFIEDDAEAVDVRACVYRHAARLFGAHVAAGADAEALRRETCRPERRLGDPEVGQDGALIGVKQHIAGGDIAMHAAARVRVTQRRAEHADDAIQAFPGQSGADALGKVAAGQQLHREIVQAGVGYADVIDRHDGRMLHGRQHARLLQKARRLRGIARQFRRKHLECDLPIQQNLPRTVNRRHAAAPDLLTDVIAAYLNHCPSCSCRKIHKMFQSVNRSTLPGGRLAHAWEKASGRRRNLAVQRCVALIEGSGGFMDRPRSFSPLGIAQRKMRR